MRRSMMGLVFHVEHGVAWRGVAWRGVAWRGVAWRGGPDRSAAKLAGGEPTGPVPPDSELESRRAPLL